jgi:hypothetical protein
MVPLTIWALDGHLYSRQPFILAESALDFDHSLILSYIRNEVKPRMIDLRPYQTDAIDQMRALMKQGCRSMLYQGATGSGKTALTAHMLHTAAQRGMTSWFVVHRRELIKQSAAAFEKEGIKYGIIAAGFEEDRRSITQLASIQTLSKRFSRFLSPSLIVWDECHHLAAGSWQKIFQAFPRSYHIGLSATPARLDGKGLGQYFKTILTMDTSRTTASMPRQPSRLKASISAWAILMLENYLSEQTGLQSLDLRLSIIGDSRWENEQSYFLSLSNIPSTSSRNSRPPASQPRTLTVKPQRS